MAVRCHLARQQRQTSRNVTQTKADYRPTYVSSVAELNDRPAVRFGGTDSLLSSPTFNPAIPFTIFGVGALPGKNPQAKFCCQQWFTGGNHRIAFGVAIGPYAPANSFWAWVQSERCTYGVNDSFNTDWHIHAYVVADANSMNWRWYYDGVLTGTAPHSEDPARTFDRDRRGRFERYERRR